MLDKKVDFDRESFNSELENKIPYTNDTLGNSKNGGKSLPNTVIQKKMRGRNSDSNRLSSFLQQTNLRTKAIAFSVSLGTIPVLIFGSITHHFIHKSIYSITHDAPHSDEVELIKEDTHNHVFMTIALATLLTGLIASGAGVIVANRIVLRILAATFTVKSLAKGNLHNRVAVSGNDEIAALGFHINRMADQLEEVLLQQRSEAEQLKLFTNSLISIRHSANPENLMNAAVTEVRRSLNVDRVVVYRFDFQGGGEVIAESAASDIPQALGEKIQDSCITQELIEAYKNGRVLAVNNVFEAGFAPEHLQLMERLCVKSSLITPIVKDNQLFGFLIAHNCHTVRFWQSYEVNFVQQLAIQVGITLERVRLLEDTQVLKNFAVHLSSSLSIPEIYNLAVQNVRNALLADRVVIYKFNEDLPGKIVAESVLAGCPSSVGVEINDPCCKDYIEKYQQGQILAINNIYEANLTECYQQQLESFGVKANLVAPILVGNKLLGLLIAHQCIQPRTWEQSEIDLLEQFARILGMSIERANLLEITEQALEAAEISSKQQREQKEQLQQELLRLLNDIEAAAEGDLTVRAEVTNGEMGTVADFFNSIIESLRETVTQVKHAASEVNVAISDNSGAINELATEALRQAEEVNRTLDSVGEMRISIKDIAISARKAASVARTAYKTAETGGTAMDLTVENILSLRETIGETAKKVKRLGESSQQISRVVSLINQIAVQTNLLAINAGIEAARAGEGSQGFAVVAEEVSALAARSASATTEIEGIVANIQRETSEVVKAMELGTSQVVEGTRLVEDTKDCLYQILDVSGQIDELVQSISSATVSQVQTSKQVAHLMREVAQLSEMTSESSHKVSASLEKTVEISHELQSSVGTFKINPEA